jgi:hypothetical protein
MLTAAGEGALPLPEFAAYNTQAHTHTCIYIMLTAAGEGALPLPEFAAYNTQAHTHTHAFI